MARRFRQTVRELIGLAVGLLIVFAVILFTAKHSTRQVEIREVPAASLDSIPETPADTVNDGKARKRKGRRKSGPETPKPKVVPHARNYLDEPVGSR